MTTHYVDLRVLPDPESSPAQLLGSLYDRLHSALVQQHVDNIGVSFPGYSINPRAIGIVLRLHASNEILQSFLRTDWLKGMRDHVRSGGVAAVPSNAPHRSVQRRQFKTSAARLRRRRMRRKGETAEQVRQAIPSSVERNPTLPFIHLHSRSTSQPFCLFIALGRLVPEPVAGDFNSYGLGGPATIPWF